MDYYNNTSEIDIIESDTEKEKNFGGCREQGFHV